MDLKKIGNNISNARSDMGITQEQLAEKVSFSKNHISRIETGKGTMSLKSLVAIGNALNTTPDYLLSLEKRIAVDISDLDEEDKTTIINLIARLKQK